MDKKIKAKDIMTTYVKTVPPSMKVQEVWEMMIEYGYTGFPVVQDGKVLGIITRSDLDRALKHNLSERKIEEFMSYTVISVSPEEEIDNIKNLFIRYGIGRVLVMEGEKLLGIITRTDLLQADRIDLYNREKSENFFINKKMKEFLSPFVMRLLCRIGEIGESLGYAVFIVGGIVRDILLGYKNLDIDIVVEGDGITLAKKVKELFDVELKIFPEFGTASLKFKDGLRCDIATSRVEFYDYPGAPPKVEVSSIKKDLYRRDFTINALAIRINPSEFGRLIDFFGGVYDLRHKLIRILHNLSFIEDPSRILRAVRFETRYDFRIEEKTLYFLKKAVSENYIEKIKAPKLREEFFYILEEGNPLKPVVRLDELKVMERIFPGFRSSPLLYDAFVKVISKKDMYKDKVRLPYVYFFIILKFVKEEKNIWYILDKFSIPNIYKEKVSEVLFETEEILNKIKIAKRRSEVYNILYKYPVEIVVFLEAFSSSLDVEEKIEDYIFNMRNVRPLLSGYDILKLGLKEGKEVGYVLGRLRDLRIDGEVNSREDEEKKAKEFINMLKEKKND